MAGREKSFKLPPAWARKPELRIFEKVDREVHSEKYAEHGYGLWVVETREGPFVGDCGLAWQQVNGTLKLEVGYHVRVPGSRTPHERQRSDH